MASRERNRERPKGQGQNGIEVGLGDAGAVTPRERRRRETKPLDDPDAEAFCRVYARIVLRVRGLAGLPRSVSAEEEAQSDSA